MSEKKCQERAIALLQCSSDAGHEGLHAMTRVHILEYDLNKAILPLVKESGLPFVFNPSMDRKEVIISMLEFIYEQRHQYAIFADDIFEQIQNLKR